MTGAEVKALAKKEGVALWRVAAEYGVTDSTFSRKLRSDFSDADTKKLLEIIDKLRVSAH